MSHVVQTPSQLSIHLRALRRAKGLSQADLGTKLSLSQARVARIEGNPLSISVEQLLRVFSALGVRMGLEELPLAAGDTAVQTKPIGPSTDGDW
jgi:HTH-type transcriptional regulator/antitoxin HipB